MRPSIERFVIPAASACRRPPTLIMKISSTLLVKMERKRSRASSGVARSSASASTRALNSSSDSSGLRTGSRACRATGWASSSAVLIICEPRLRSGSGAIGGGCGTAGNSLVRRITSSASSRHSAKITPLKITERMNATTIACTPAARPMPTARKM